MAAPDVPQIYLLTPPEFELSDFPSRLDDVLDAHDVACVRLSLSSRDEDRIARAADAVREVCHAADVACVIEAYVGLVERL
ncbi:MAG: thiamine phosphate synthase, partial [Pseudomonadota bacterium]